MAHETEENTGHDTPYCQIPDQHMKTFIVYKDNIMCPISKYDGANISQWLVLSSSLLEAAERQILSYFIVNAQVQVRLELGCLTSLPQTPLGWTVPPAVSAWHYYPAVLYLTNNAVAEWEQCPEDRSQNPLKRKRRRLMAMVLEWGVQRSCSGVTLAHQRLFTHITCLDGISIKLYTQWFKVKQNGRRLLGNWCKLYKKNDQFNRNELSLEHI